MRPAWKGEINMSRLLQNYPNRITLEFGDTELQGQPYYHNGIDIVGEAGWTYGALDYIIAHSSGRIIEVGYEESGRGYYTIVDIGNGVHMEYCHLDDNIWMVDEYIEQGDVIGYMGNSGNCTGAHLHFAINDNGEYVNPEPFLDCDYERVIVDDIPVVPTPVQPTDELEMLDTLIDQIADNVIAGRYGNGIDRANALGQYYNLIQSRVNYKLL